MMVGKVGETPVMKRPSTRQPSKPRRVMRKPSASGDMGQDGTPKRKEAAPSLPIPEIPKEAKKGSTKKAKKRGGTERGKILSSVDHPNGWKVVEHQTPKGRVYKKYIASDGEYYFSESTAAQHGFKAA